MLSQYEREQLAEVMLWDVLAVLRSLRRVEGVIVVTADPSAVEIAHSFGACVVPDRSEAGVNMAVIQGLQALEGSGGPVAVVAADIPFATPEGIEQVLTGLESDPVVLAPAITDGGLTCSPCGAAASSNPRLVRKVLLGTANSRSQLN